MRAELASPNHCAVPFYAAPAPTCAGTAVLFKYPLKRLENDC